MTAPASHWTNRQIDEIEEIYAGAGKEFTNAHQANIRTYLAIMQGACGDIAEVSLGSTDHPSFYGFTGAGAIGSMVHVDYQAGVQMRRFRSQQGAELELPKLIFRMRLMDQGTPADGIALRAATFSSDWVAVEQYRTIMAPAASAWKRLQEITWFDQAVESVRTELEECGAFVPKVPS